MGQSGDIFGQYDNYGIRKLFRYNESDTLSGYELCKSERKNLTFSINQEDQILSLKHSMQ